MVPPIKPVKPKFIIGEKVLCYEPDKTKAIVLYDSKVLEVIETKDKRGRKIIEYLIHFQGWNSSWDRRVLEDRVLRDTEDNRELQRSLAEKSQLHIGAYLYRRERKKRIRKLSSGSYSDLKNRRIGSSDDGSSCSPLGREEHETSEFNQLDQNMDQHLQHHHQTGIIQDTTDSYSSSVESFMEEERVVLNVGDQFKKFLDYDGIMVTQQHKLVNLPATIPIITILENCVKYYSIKSICSPNDQDPPTRRRNSAAKVEKKEPDYDKIINSINLRKEVADGLRIYFDFTLQKHLLYAEEKDQANDILSEENMRKFKFVLSESFDFSMFDDGVKTNKYNSTDSVQNQEIQPIDKQKHSKHQSTTNDTKDDEHLISRKRILRSHKIEETDVAVDVATILSTTTNTTITTTSSKTTTSNVSSTLQSATSNEINDCNDNKISTTSPTNRNVTSNPTTIGSCSGNNIALSNIQMLRKYFPQTNKYVTPKSKEIIDNVLSWHMLPSDASTEPSMIYGGIHLARLIVKLPDFLNASSMSDDKLKTLLKYLDNFIEYIENHSEWFGEDHYIDANSKNENSNCNISDASCTTSSSIINTSNAEESGQLNQLTSASSVENDIQKTK